MQLYHGKTYLGLLSADRIDDAVDCWELGTNCQNFVADVFKNSALFTHSTRHSSSSAHYIIKLHSIRGSVESSTAHRRRSNAAHANARNTILVADVLYHLVVPVQIELYCTVGD